MTIKLVTVTFAVDVSEARKGFEEAFIADCVNESFRELQRSYKPESAILDYALDGARPSSASVEGYEEGDAFSFMDERLPTAVLEVDGGVINSVRSTIPMRVVVLDADTEGGDDENIAQVNGEDVYVFDEILSGHVDLGGVDPEFVDDVLSQLPSNGGDASVT